MKLVSTPSSEGKIETCRLRGEVGHARFDLMKGGYRRCGVFDSLARVGMGEGVIYLSLSEDTTMTVSRRE